MYLTLIIVGIAARIRAWRARRAAIHALSRLTDYELKDIGLSRGDIGFVTREKAPARGQVTMVLDRIDPEP